MHGLTAVSMLFIFELTNDDLKDAEQFGWALKTMNESRDSFKAQFKQFAEIVLKLTSNQAFH